VQPGRSYTWRLVIDEVSQLDWQQSFHVRSPNPG